MTSRGHWRDRLLGTLQGQLQLATYVTVFLGFTGASCAGLWVSERNLFRQHSMAIEQSAAGIALARHRVEVAAVRPVVGRRMGAQQHQCCAQQHQCRNEIHAQAAWSVGPVP